MRFTTGQVLLFTLITAFFAQANERTLSVRTLATEKGEMPVWYVAVGEQQFKQLEWPTTQPSLAVSAQAGEELVLYLKEANQGGEPEFRLARRVAIPGTADEVLLLGWPVDNDEQAELLAIADNYKKAEFNDWLVINLSQQTVTLRYGTGNEPVSLESGGTKTYQITAERDKGGEVIAEAVIKGKKKKIYSTFWAASEKQRFLILFYSKDDRIRLRRIVDFLPAKEKEDSN